LLEESLRFLVTVSIALPNAIHGETTVNSALDHVGATVSILADPIVALSVVGALAATAATAISTALLAFAVGFAEVYALEGEIVALCTWRTDTADTATTVRAALLGEPEDGALGLAL